MVRHVVLILLLSMIALNSGCATIIKGTTERVYITASPSNSKVEVDGVPIVAGVRGYLVKRDRDHVVRVAKLGYETKTVRMESGFSASGVLLSIFGNILIPGSLIWIILDIVDGSWFGFDPDTVHVSLVPKYDVKPKPPDIGEQPRGTLCVKCGFYFPRDSRFCNQCGERSAPLKGKGGTR